MSDTRFSLSFPVIPDQADALLKAASDVFRLPMTMSLPAQKGQQAPQIPLDLSALMVASREGDTLRLISQDEGFDRVALAWCRSLSELPPSALPVAQRMGVRLFQKIPDEETGNALVDRGRRLVLDQVRRQLMPAIVGEVGRRMSSLIEAFCPRCPRPSI